MRKFYAILFGSIGALIMSLFFAAVAVYIDFNLISFKFFFIVPVGAFFMGYVSTMAYYKAAKALDVEYKKYMNVAAAFMAFFSFIFIYYYIYRVTYISSDYKINHSFQGQHISNFQRKGSSSRIDFKEYLDMVVTSRKSTAFFSSGSTLMPMASFNATDNGNWLLFLVEWAGYVIGGSLWIGHLKLEDFCQVCRRYERTKKLSSMKETDFAKKYAEDEETTQVVFKMAKGNYKLPLVCFSSHIRVEARYCPSCFKGRLLTRHMTFDGYKFEERFIKRATIEAESEVIKEILK